MRRYVLLERLGEGGMGTVYAAYDARLDRKVALKVLRREENPLARARFLREAQALGRLHHPNVVTAFDAGAVGERPYLAMALVEGTTLRRWLHERRRAWREIAAAFVAAGRGLAAAHRAGLVHRDIKPDNILVGNDGSIQVADFGLARFAGESETRPDGGGGPAESPLLTAGVIGTPRYMAPEQAAGRDLDERADQWSFCASLGEALEEVAAPGFLRRVVARGKANDPADRYPTMDALLADLDRDHGRRRRLAALAVAVAAVAGALAVVATRPRADACLGAGRDFGAVWNGERRSAVARRLLASGLPYAGVAAERAVTVLDQWAAAFVRARVAACGAADEARGTCLADLAGEAQAKIEALLAADRKAAGRVDDILGTLPDVDDCRGVTAEGAALRLPRDRERRLQTMTVRSHLFAASALVTAGQTAAAAELSTSALAEARALGHRPTVALALSVRAQASGRSGDWRGEARLHGETMQAAAEVGDDGLLAASATRLAILLGSLEPGGFDEARRLGGLGLAVARHTGRDRLIVKAEYGLGQVELVAGRPTDARRHFEAALALAERSIGSEDVLTTIILNGLAEATSDCGDPRAALGHFQRALAIRTRLSGAQHRAVADTRGNVAIVLAELGLLGEARAAYLESLAVVSAALGPHHGQVANLLVNLTATEVELGLLDEAVARGRANLPMMAEIFGEDSLLTGGAHRVYGLALAASDRLAEARPEIERDLAIAEKAGRDHPRVIDALEAVAFLAARERRWPEALAALERAAAVADKTESGVARAARVRQALAWVALTSGDPRRAAFEASRAWLLAAGGRGPSLTRRNADVLLAAALVEEGRPALDRLLPLVVAAASRCSQGATDRAIDDLARFALARELWRTGERARARALATDAADGFRAGRQWVWAERAGAWLAAHGGPPG